VQIATSMVSGELKLDNFMYIYRCTKNIKNKS